MLTGDTFSPAEHEVMLMVKTEQTQTGIHLRVRATGDCEKCGTPWPCDPARAEMLGQLAAGDTDRASLGMWLSTEMLDQQQVFSADRADELRRRYLSWIPRRAKSHRGSVPRPRASGRQEE